MFYIGSVLTAIASFLGVSIARKILTFPIFMAMLYFLLDYASFYLISLIDLSIFPNNFLYILCKFEIIKILNFYISAQVSIFLIKSVIKHFSK